MILRHRDREILRFEWLDAQRLRIVSVNEAELKFLPIPMKGAVNDEVLAEWLRHRAVPKNRAYIAQMLDNLGIFHDDLGAIIGFSRGLSLNDVHWVVSEAESDLTWRQVNLYENDFSDVMAFMAFTGAEGTVSPGSTSPEMTTNGMLAKCWRRINGVPVLYKGGTEGSANSGFEPYSEFYAAQIAEALGLPHVSYGLAKYKGRLCSICPCFTSDRIGYLPAGRTGGKSEVLADSRFANVFLFDAIICNPDRHLGNLGYLVDNDTNEITGVAPIFDNGCGLFSSALFRNKHIDEFSDLSAFAAKRTPVLYHPWLNIPGGITEAMRSMVMRLNGFRFSRHDNYNLPAERLRIIEDFIQKRIREIAGYDQKIIVNSDVVKDCDTDRSKNRRLDDTDVDRIILDNLKADPFLSVKELAELLEVSVVTVKRKISRLKVSGSVRRIGSAKSGHWEVLGIMPGSPAT